MAQHDPSFRNTQRDSTQHVLRAVERAVGLLQFAADDNVDIRTVDGWRGIAYAELDPADLHVRIADNAEGLRPEPLLQVCGERPQRRFGNHEPMRLRRRFVLAFEAES